MNECIGKPFRVNDLAAVIERWTGPRAASGMCEPAAGQNGLAEEVAWSENERYPSRHSGDTHAYADSPQAPELSGQGRYAWAGLY